MTVASGMITTVAGTGEQGYSGDGGPATQAHLSEPFLCAFDPQGNLYIAEVNNGRAQKFAPRDGANPELLVGRPLRSAWE